jgi:hypothetical protein
VSETSDRAEMCGIFFSLYAEPSGTDAEGWKEPFDSICDRLRQLNTERGVDTHYLKIALTDIQG